MKIKLVWKRGDIHERCTVFIGDDKDHLASCGTLTLLSKEAEAFRLVIRSGIDPRTGIDGIFEAGWDESA